MAGWGHSPWRAVTLLAAGAIAVVGVVLGVVATSAPTVESGGNHERIRVWVDRPDVAINFRWSMDPSGEITMFLNVDDDTAERAVVYIVLTCGARMASTFSGGELVDEFGSETDCEHPKILGSDPATQVISVAVEAVGQGAVTGLTRDAWVATAAGRRAARTPQMFFAWYQPLEPELADLDLELVGVGSSFDLSLSATTTETLDTYIPNADAGGVAVSTSASIFSGLTGETPVVLGSVSWSAAGPAAGMQGAYASWQDSGGIARAQFQLLLAGVLLGVAASVVVEFLMDLARGPNARRSGAREGRSSRRNAL
jgi:hypothetical protein